MPAYEAVHAAAREPTAQLRLGIGLGVTLALELTLYGALGQTKLDHLGRRGTEW